MRKIFFTAIFLGSIITQADELVCKLTFNEMGEGSPIALHSVDLPVKAEATGEYVAHVVTSLGKTSFTATARYQKEAGSAQLYINGRNYAQLGRVFATKLSTGSEIVLSTSGSFVDNNNRVVELGDVELKCSVK